MYCLKDEIFKYYDTKIILNMRFSKRYFLFLSLSYLSLLAFNSSNIIFNYQKNIIYKKKFSNIWVLDSND